MSINHNKSAAALSSYNITCSLVLAKILKQIENSIVLHHCDLEQQLTDGIHVYTCS